ncbi:MAG: hypothetical protein U0527_06655 [Candidatus Eisenbacteria bacterium]
MRLGLIGLGAIGCTLLAGPPAHAPHVTLAAVLVRDPARAPTRTAR